MIEMNQVQYLIALCHEFCALRDVSPEQTRSCTATHAWHCGDWCLCGAVRESWTCARVCDGLFTFQVTDSGTDSDSDSKPDNYIVLCRTCSHCTDSDPYLDLDPKSLLCRSLNRYPYRDREQSPCATMWISYKRSMFYEYRETHPDDDRNTREENQENSNLVRDGVCRMVTPLFNR